MRTPVSLSERFTLELINGFVAKQLSLAQQAFAAQGLAQPRLLDVGCGRQPYRALAESLGFKYQAMDIASRDVHLDIQAALDDPQLRQRVAGGQFQVLLLTEVLEHVDGQETAWLNLAHLAADGCRVIITAPFMYPLHEQPWDACRPTIHQLKRFAERSGFVVKSLKAAGGFSATLGLLLAAAQVPVKANLLVRALGWLIWLCCRVTGRLLAAFPILDLMSTSFYVSNLMVCEKTRK